MRSLFAPLLCALFLTHVPLAQADGVDVPPSVDRAAAGAQPVAALTLDQALRLAWSHSPVLAVARLELQAMEAAERQAGARPNPELGVLLEDTRRASRTTTIQMSQAIELGGKRVARLSFAARTREQADVGLAAKQAELRAAVTGAFFEVQGAQEHERLAVGSLDLARQASRMADRRVQAGKAPPMEHTKALVAEAGVRAELTQAQSDLRLARQRLASTWAPSMVVFERVESATDSLPILPTEPELRERIVHSPALRLAQLDVASRQAQSDGARAQAVPDLTVTLGAKRDAELGRTQAVMGVSIPLPLMDRQQAQVTQALRREDQAREQWVAASVRLQLEVSQAAEKLGLAREQALLLRREVLPAAQSAVDVAMKGYELGKFAFIDVLDAQRTLSQLRQQAVRHTADAFRAAAALERLLGHPADAQRVSTE